MQLTLLFILVLIHANSSQKCVEKSFDDVYVLVQETATSENYQVVSGCISNKTIKYQKLKQLKITGQDIFILKNGAVSNIPNRFRVKIRKNNISTINEGAFLNLPELESLDLDHNSIDWIESNAFDSLPSLEAINLDSNHLELLLQNTFANLPNLTIISLDDNKLDVFKQDWFYNTPNLAYLFLNDNEIRSLPKAAFVTLPTIKGISMNGNKIAHINKRAFIGLRQLDELDLGKNLLASLDFDFKTVPNLAFLAVHQNILNYVSDSSLKSMQNSLKSIWIYLNPWQCSCLDTFLQWGMNRTIQVLWQCKNTELACIIPAEKEKACDGPISNDFFIARQQHFTTIDCIKKH